MDLDLIFSVGPACRPAYHLKQNFLRTFSCPLDWQMAYSLDTCLTLFQTGFQTFFTSIQEDSSRKGATGCRRIIDIQNSIISIHHFSSKYPLAEAQRLFRSTMLKRYYILHNTIMQSDTIGLICNRNDSIEKLSDFLLAFGNIYPNQKILLINIRDNQKLNSLMEHEYKINSQLSIREYTFSDKHPFTKDQESNSWLGNTEYWNALLARYRIKKHPFIQYLQQNIHSTKVIIIYGAGNNCRRILTFASKYGIRVSYIAVTKPENNPSFINGIPVVPISSCVNMAHKSIIIISIFDNLQATNIYTQLQKYGFTDIIKLDSSSQFIS